MSKKQWFCCLACFSAVTIFSLSARAAEDDGAPKYSTKVVMKTAFKGPLIKKVAAGDASDEEKKNLYDMLVALGKNKPPKGEADSWKKLTAALVKAGKAVVDGDADGGAMLKKAANCKACHSKHKP
ncbi:MAG: hypothetical protein GY904_30090 [Planctomycetaceae bacterium]|jgi:hypothetical protein|nr:hypothetical protein [Planctomycetaceae bacterium]